MKEHGGRGGRGGGGGGGPGHAIDERAGEGERHKTKCYDGKETEDWAGKR